MLIQQSVYTIYKLHCTFSVINPWGTELYTFLEDEMVIDKWYVFKTKTELFIKYYSKLL